MTKAKVEANPADTHSEAQETNVRVRTTTIAIPVPPHIKEAYIVNEDGPPEGPYPILGILVPTEEYTVDAIHFQHRQIDKVSRRGQRMWDDIRAPHFANHDIESLDRYAYNPVWFILAIDTESEEAPDLIWSQDHIAFDLTKAIHRWIAIALRQSIDKPRAIPIRLQVNWQSQNRYSPAVGPAAAYKGNLFARAPEHATDGTPRHGAWWSVRKCEKRQFWPDHQLTSEECVMIEALDASIAEEVDRK